MTGLPLLPAVTVEFIGSALAILLAFVALGYARALTRLQPNNFIWGFLFYFCIAMAAFSLSRGFGHMLRIILVYSGRGLLWQQLSPFSGGFNTVLMISVAAVTIYYYKGLAAYKAIRAEAEKLADANARLASNASLLQQLNTHLEEIVEERTRNLLDSEKKFRNLFENSKDIIYFCDINGNISHINSSGIDLLGFDGSAPTINFHKLFTNKEVLETYMTELCQKGSVSDLDMQCRGKDGTTRHILLSANAIYDQNGDIVGCEGIGKDMTRLRTITKQLINHEKMASVGQMAAGVAHEINTPLGIILGYTQLMMDDYPHNSETHANLQVIERQTKACRRIVTDLLKFSRQSASVKAHLDINGIIEDVLSVTEHSLNIDRIRVARRFAPDLPMVIGDVEKLHQVFINLFNNAQYAMPDGGELAISTGTVGEEILVTVADSGIGIAETIKNKIFDPFFTTKDVGSGTGLGLSVTYGIIQDHGGVITVESPVAGRITEHMAPGSAFHIRLPAADNHQPNTREDQEYGGNSRT
jgi:PAS domain S-box-containing protein